MTSPRPAVVATLLVVVAGGPLAACSASGPAPSAPRPLVASSAGPSPSAATRVTAQPGHDVLRRWDERRAAAWAAGDRGALAALYVDGSSAGERDVERLDRWRARGLVVHGLVPQRRHVVVRRDGARRRTVTVSERWPSARASGRPGSTRVDLPAGRWERRTVTLVRRDGGWLVQRVSGRSAPAR